MPLGIIRRGISKIDSNSIETHKDYITEVPQGRAYVRRDLNFEVRLNTMKPCVASPSVRILGLPRSSTAVSIASHLYEMLRLFCLALCLFLGAIQERCIFKRSFYQMTSLTPLPLSPTQGSMCHAITGNSGRGSVLIPDVHCQCGVATSHDRRFPGTCLTWRTSTHCSVKRSSAIIMNQYDGCVG